MKKILLTLLFTLLLSNTAQAKDMKFGVVSVEAILKNAPQVIAINKKMQDRFTAPQQELKKLGESIKASQEKFKKDDLILSKQQKSATQKKILASIQQYRESEMKLKNEVDDVRNQALAEFRFTVQKVLNQLAEDKGYDFIFSEGVAYAKKEFDLTNEVLTRLKKLSESEK
ncbi:MAG: OmpH family outer membrane protein [Gammaproteobacteria bacterium]|nr:OmpH family outer membrane protein [Gammaproteobacteria bacterium]